MTLDSITLGSMHIWVSWFRLTRVQLVTAPATRLLPLSSAFTIRSSTAVALNSLMLEACRSDSELSSQWGLRLIARGGTGNQPAVEYRRSLSSACQRLARCELK